MSAVDKRFNDILEQIEKNTSKTTREEYSSAHLLSSGKNTTAVENCDHYKHPWNSGQKQFSGPQKAVHRARQKERTGNQRKEDSHIKQRGGQPTNLQLQYRGYTRREKQIPTIN